LEQSAYDGCRNGCTPEIDPDLQAIIDAWPELPDTARETVLRIIAEASAGERPPTPSGQDVTNMRGTPGRISFGGSNHR